MKKSNICIIIIIIVITILLIISTFTLKRKSISTNNISTSTTDRKVVPENPPRPTSTPTSQPNIPIVTTSEPAEEKVLTKEEKLKKHIETIIANASLYFPIDNINNLDQNIVDQIVYSQIKYTGNKFSKNQFDKVLYEYFSNDIIYNYKDIKCQIESDPPMFFYDSVKKEYIYNENHLGHGGSSATDIPTYLSFEDNGDYYIVKTKIIYGAFCGGPCVVGPNMYANAKDSFYETNIIGTIKNGVYPTDEEITNQQDKLPITTFTFKKNNDNYGLVSVTIN